MTSCRCEASHSHSHSEIPEIPICSRVLKGTLRILLDGVRRVACTTFSTSLLSLTAASCGSIATKALSKVPYLNTTLLNNATFDTLKTQLMTQYEQEFSTLVVQCAGEIQSAPLLKPSSALLLACLIDTVVHSLIGSSWPASIVQAGISLYATTHYCFVDPTLVDLKEIAIAYTASRLIYSIYRTASNYAHRP